MTAPACREFRAALEGALRGRARPERTAELSWHEHLLSCEPCRDLLSAEEALEELLATLPAPRLPADLAERVIARLADDRALHASELDGLLDLDRVPDAPPDLADRVLARLSDERREARLEALLDRLPEPTVPADLAERVLAGLAPERARPASRLALVRGALPGYAWAAAAAALVAVAGLVWKLAVDEPPAQQPRSDEPVLVDAPEPKAAPMPEPEVPSDELLEALPVLERWELLFDEDLDVQLASLDAIEDELRALGYEDEEDGG